jgi:hypothetical protein
VNGAIESTRAMARGLAPVGADRGASSRACSRWRCAAWSATASAPTSIRR